MSDDRRQSREYKAGMRVGLANGRGGNPIVRGMKDAGVSYEATTRELPASDRGGERSSLNGGGIRLVVNNTRKAASTKGRAVLRVVSSR